jgi:hypothetical protein
MLNLCRLIYVVRTADVFHQLLNPVFSNPCLSACLHCIPVHVHSMLHLILWSHVRSLLKMLIAFLCYHYMVLYYLIAFFNAVNYPYNLLC